MKISDSETEFNTPKAREVSSKIRAASLAGLRAYLDKSLENDELSSTVPNHRESVLKTGNAHAYNELPSHKKEHMFARATESSSKFHSEKKSNLHDQTYSRSHSTPLKSNDSSYTVWPSQRSIAVEPVSRLDAKGGDGTLWTPTSSPPARFLDTQQAYYSSRTEPAEPAESRDSLKDKKKVQSLIMTAALGFIALTILTFLYYVFMKHLDECISDRNFLSQALGGDTRLNMKSFNSQILRDLENV